MYARSLIIFFFFFILIREANSQDQQVIITDSTQLNTDNIETIKSKNFFDPSRAALLSAVLPGLGQVYNRKYWKVPIVWGGLFLGVYLANAYNNELQFWRTELFLYLNGGTSTTGASQRRVEQIIQRFRRDRDQTIIYTFMWYGLNIVDAHVDAYLKEFNVNDQLALKLEPYLDSNPVAQTEMFGGVTLVLKFR